MLPMITPRHFQCPDCATFTQMLIRFPEWVCPQCGHVMEPIAEQAEQQAPPTLATSIELTVKPIKTAA